MIGRLTLALCVGLFALPVDASTIATRGAASAQGFGFNKSGVPLTPGTTWNPADKNGNLTLSPDNLTVTQTAGNTNNAGVRAIAGKTTGKFYFELNSSGTAGPFNMGFGIGNSSATIITSPFWNSFNGVGYRANGGVLLNGNALANVSAWDVGTSTEQLAIDLSAKLLWVRKVGDPNWNGNPAADPATGVGGIALTGLLAGPYFPIYNSSLVGDTTTVNFGPTYVGTVPAGFLQWK